MAIRAWVHCVGQNQKRAENDVVAFLSQNGVDIQGFDPYLARGSGVLLFGEVTGDICDLLREVSGNGHARVLACGCATLSAECTWRLMQAGASDVMSCVEGRQAAHEIIARLMRWDAVDRLVDSPSVGDLLVGQSPAWKASLRQVVEVAHFTDASVLILGDSGTGKELVARLIHTLDPHAGKQGLVVLDCSTIMPELSGSEFFGHERGAFTGAVSARDGAFALADRGTLFLDEVGELPVHLQTQLLRVIQEHAFKRVGGNAWQHTSFRLVCATNRDLCASVQRGEFRADLYYRLATFVCNLPPLRERPEDILCLTRHFLREIRPDQDPPELDTPVQEYLLRRNIPAMYAS